MRDSLGDPRSLNLLSHPSLSSFPSFLLYSFPSLLPLRFGFSIKFLPPLPSSLPSFSTPSLRFGVSISFFPPLFPFLIPSILPFALALPFPPSLTSSFFVLSFPGRSSDVLRSHLSSSFLLFCSLFSATSSSLHCLIYFVTSPSSSLLILFVTPSPLVLFS